MRPRWSIQESTRQFFEQTLKALLCVLIAVLLAAIAIGLVKTFLDLRLIWQQGVHEGFKQVLVDALTILAVVEVFRTAMAYFTEGRVKVTYIIDTVLVTVLTEVLAFWFKDMEPSRITLVIALVLSFGLIRVVAIRFSPDQAEVADGL